MMIIFLKKRDRERDSVNQVMSDVFDIPILRGFPGGSVIKNLPANRGDMGLIPESGRSLGKGNGNQRQYSCLGNPVDRGAWWATVHGLHIVRHDWKQPNTYGKPRSKSRRKCS